jgi:hypothetical protein
VASKKQENGLSTLLVDNSVDDVWMTVRKSHDCAAGIIVANF